MELVAQKEQRFELKKHINAIHCSNNLSLIQRKLFNALLFNAYSDLAHKSQFEIPARALCNLIGYNSNDYAKLKRALVALMTVVIEWNVIDYSSIEVTGKWRASSALSSAKLENGFCTYEYSSLIRELFYQPEIYGRLNMRVLAQFKSSYGLALYENCVRYQRLPQTPWFPLEIFRKLMGVFDDKYDAFKDFKKRVLNIAVLEVNQHSPLTICPEIKRENQKVTSIRFKLANKRPTLSDFSISKNSENNELVDSLLNIFAFSPEAMNDILMQYEASYIREKIAVILQSESFRLGKIKGLAGYLVDALRRDYKPNKSSHTVIDEVRCKKEEAATIEKAKQQEQQNVYNEYLNATIDTYLKTLSKKELKSLMLAFETSLNTENKVVTNWFYKFGLQHPGVKGVFNHFVREQNLKEGRVVLNFEEFQQQEH